MRDVQQHQAHGTMKDCFLALEIGDYLVHRLVVKVSELLSGILSGVFSRTELPL